MLVLQGVQKWQGRPAPALAWWCRSLAGWGFGQSSHPSVHSVAAPLLRWQQLRAPETYFPKLASCPQQAPRGGTSDGEEEPAGEGSASQPQAAGTAGRLQQEAALAAVAAAAGGLSPEALADLVERLVQQVGAWERLM